MKIQCCVEIEENDLAFIDREVERIKQVTAAEGAPANVTRDQVISTLIETGIGVEQALPKEQRTPKMGEVWREIAKREEFGGGKVVIRHPSLIATIEQFPQLYEFVCDRAHGDNDFDYLCGSEYCRCMQ